MAKSVVKRVYDRVVVTLERRRNSRRSRSEVFAEIYRTKRWGGDNDDISSGDGSTRELAEPYSALVSALVLEVDAKSIVDIGCGDFVVGACLTSKLPPGVDYIGVDIVDAVVQRNRRRFASERVSFVTGDAVEGSLPKGDIALLRQVLQHLSNDEISKVLEHCHHHYRLVVITEHYPDGSLEAIVPNRDKPHGPDTRVFDGSAVVLDQPPFSLQRVSQVLELPEPTGGVLRTFCWSPQA